MVSLFFFQKKFRRNFVIILIVLIFSGCGKHVIKQSTVNFQKFSQKNSIFYLRKMSQTLDNAKTNWQLLAILALLKEGKVQQATTLFSELSKTLSKEQLREKILLSAELKIAKKDYISAKKILNIIDFNQLDKNQQTRFWQANIDSEQRCYPLTALRALIWQEPFLSHKDKQRNIDHTWRVLTTITQKQANQILIKANENILQGWFDLLQIWLNHRSDIEVLKNRIRDWQARYPRNPGAKMLPTQLVAVQNFKPTSSIKKITLLLPLNGQAGIFGRAIQQGFQAAKNSVSPITSTRTIKQATNFINVANIIRSSDKNNNKVITTNQKFSLKNTQDLDKSKEILKSIKFVINTTVQGNNRVLIKRSSISTKQLREREIVKENVSSSIELKIYDTNTQSFDEILRQIQHDNVDIIVGPLLKTNVKKLITNNITLDSLVLNQIEEVQNRHNICYFSLSPEDEARDAARHIYEQNKHSPLLLIPCSKLGNRIAQAFVEEWQKLSSNIVLQQTFNSPSELHAKINQGRGIFFTGVPIKLGLQKKNFSIDGLTIPSIQKKMNISSTNKVDAVYIVATQEEISFIKPMIVMCNKNQKDVSLYASSRSIESDVELDFRLEMDGLQYSEIPLLAQGNSIMTQETIAKVHNNYILARLYAMGNDAWMLINHFSQMRQIPGYELSGNTGNLTANENCVIQRRLSWLQFHQGKIILAN